LPTVRTKVVKVRFAEIADVSGSGTPVCPWPISGPPGKRRYSVETPTMR